MNVWIINPFDNLPVEGYRPQRYWLMSEAFARAGHTVTFWTQDWSHAKKVRRGQTAAVPLPPSLHPQPFSLIYVHVPGYRKNICPTRIWSHWRFARNWAALAAGRAAPDLIVVSSPPLFIGREVRRFCARTGAKCIVDIMDAWPETFERVAPHWALGWMRRLVRDNYRNAAGITAVAQRYLDLAKSYGATCPLHLCYHGIAAENMQTKPPEACALPENASSVLQLVYVGNMSLSYDLATAVDAVKGDEGLSLDLAGAGPDEAALRQRAKGCGRIRFHGYLADAALRALLARADVGLVPMFDASCVGVPYKLADYAAAGLPALSSLHGETAALLARHDAGVTYLAGDAAALRQAARAAIGKRLGAASLARIFDAGELYKGYVAFATAL